MSVKGQLCGNCKFSHLNNCRKGPPVTWIAVSDSQDWCGEWEELPETDLGLDRQITTVLGDLSVRTRHALRRLGLKTMRELTAITADDLLDCKNFGVTGLNEIREKLDETGYSLS